MPQALDETYEPRPWRCGECGLILGVVMRDANRVRKLYTFLRARTDTQMPTQAELWERPRGMFIGHGVNSCDGWECPLCGGRTEWTPSREAYEKLMSHYQKEVVSESV